jgi:hypothetical protein
VSRATWVSDPERKLLFGYWTITISGGPFQILHLRNFFVTLRPLRTLARSDPTTPPTLNARVTCVDGLGCSRFARRYSGNRVCFLFLGVLRCFSSPSLPLSPMDSGIDILTLLRMGCPIRVSPDLRLFAASRGLSQLTTPFIASERQGIHHMPLIT